MSNEVFALLAIAIIVLCVTLYAIAHTIDRIHKRRNQLDTNSNFLWEDTKNCPIGVKVLILFQESGSRGGSLLLSTMGKSSS